MKYLNDTKVNDLIERIKSGDNAAWEELCRNYEVYIHDRGWKRLKKLDLLLNRSGFIGGGEREWKTILKKKS